MPDDFTHQCGNPVVKGLNTISLAFPQQVITFNILLSLMHGPAQFRLTPDDFTRQCGKSHGERVNE